MLRGRGRGRRGRGRMPPPPPQRNRSRGSLCGDLTIPFIEFMTPEERTREGNPFTCTLTYKELVDSCARETFGTLMARHVQDFSRRHPLSEGTRNDQQDGGADAGKFSLKTSTRYAVAVGIVVVILGFGTLKFMKKF